MTVEVFKTNLQDDEQAAVLAGLLHQSFPHSRVDFDLEDCDRILRIEGGGLCPVVISNIIAGAGFECSVLD